MAVDKGILKKRLREAFGSDSQETVGQKLHMTQGNVSKLLAGVQQPGLDTLYNISKSYDVSIDWLMGLTNRKKCIKTDDEISYSLATEVICDVVSHGAKVDKSDRDGTICITVSDPLLVKLVLKSCTLAKTDKEMFADWKESRLSLFDDRPLLWRMTFSDEGVLIAIDESSSEADLAKSYDYAREKEDEIAFFMSD